MLRPFFGETMTHKSDISPLELVDGSGTRFSRSTIQILHPLEDLSRQMPWSPGTENRQMFGGGGGGERGELKVRIDQRTKG